MRFMMIVKASADSEAGVMPGRELLEAMGKYNEELANAGMLLAGEGLRPSSDGARVTFSPAGSVVTDGPFAETKELVAGFWLIRADSLEEAVRWARRVPFTDGQIEVRTLFETEDFAEVDPTGEIRAAEHRLRERVGN